MLPFIVTAFYTKNTPYRLVLDEYLLPTLKKFNIQHIMWAIEPQGSWRRNVAKKPEIVLNTLEQYPDHNVVVLDVDCRILKYPSLFESIPESYDIGVHYLNWNAWYGYNDNPPKLELLTGTVFLNNTDKVKNLVRRWKLDADMSGAWEQKVLQAIIEKERGAYNVYELPLEYCYINTLPDGTSPLVKIENPVIEHYQVSRKFKSSLL